MKIKLIKDFSKTGNRTKAEWEAIRLRKTLHIISEIVTTESKLDISSEDAVACIRQCLNDNL